MPSSTPAEIKRALEIEMKRSQNHLAYLETHMAPADLAAAKKQYATATEKKGRGQS